MNESRKDEKDTIEFLLGIMPWLFRRWAGCPKLDEEDYKRAREITEEDTGYFDRLANRIIAEAEVNGGSIAMEELLGMHSTEESRSHQM